jgi:hypothetical protein
MLLIAADNALKSAAEAGDRTSNVDKKFRETIHLLSRFEKEFPSKKPNTGGTVTREANRNDKSKSPSWILHALKKNLHSKVNFPSVYLSLNADES